jgi:hypothetical protein
MNELPTNKNITVAPSIDLVDLTHKQIFPTRPNIVIENGVTITPNGVAKNTIRFDREEDMIVMCLSAFVHDYVHDYNLGSYHARVLSGNNVARVNPNEPSLFESLGITIGNTIFKIIAYGAGRYSGDHKVTLYDDNQFEDVQTNDQNKNNFYNYQQTFEEPIYTSGGATILSDLSSSSAKKSFISVKQDMITNTSISTKPTHYEDISILLTKPTINNLDFGPIVNAFENNADFLSFHSSLNTYVVTYLGYTDDNIADADNKDTALHKSILNSFNYIIQDFEQGNSINYNFYGDIFKLLKESYEIIYNKNIFDNSFDILNSTEILYQFIIFYVSYLSVTDYTNFETLLDTKIGGGEDDEDGNGDGDGNVDDDDNDDEQNNELNISSDGSPLLPVPEKTQVRVPEYVFITHNNLLTTIARGMFIKLGIWGKLFPDVINPEDYIFGYNELNQITYDRLKELYPIDAENGGNKNNELLILEILILKRLLVEMSPSKTLSFGNKIDDDLKNYIDSFYYDYYIKNNNVSYKPEIDIDPDVSINPAINEDTEEITALFAMCDEDCDDEHDINESSIESEMMEGGGKTGEIEMVEFKKPIQEQQIVTNTDESVVNNIIPDTNITENVAENVSENVSENVVVPNNLSVIDEYKIIEPPAAPPMPILFNKLKKMYQNNIYTIKQLQNSKIEPVTINGTIIDNVYDLLTLNETLISKINSNFKIPAPKYKFVINNAANVKSNINGSRLFLPNSFSIVIGETLKEIKDNVFTDNTINQDKLTQFTKQVEEQLETINKNLQTNIEPIIIELNRKKKAKAISINEYNTLLKLTYDKKVIQRTELTPLENKLFLLDKLEEDINLPEESQFFKDFETNYKKWFKDCQALFGLYRNLERGIFCPTSSMMDAMDNCSLKYNASEPKEVGTTYSELIYERKDETGNIIKTISFGGVVLNYNKNDSLIAKLHYNLVCQNREKNDVVDISTLDIQVSQSNDLKSTVAYKRVVNKIKEIYYSNTNNTSNPIKDMWETMQFQLHPFIFNDLLSATILKTMGDYLQECQACFKWGGYINTIDQFSQYITLSPAFQEIQNNLIYRSVSKGGSIIPYDSNGNALRLGIQGDRPSGFRSIYILLNGKEAVNDQSITGYVYTNSTQNPSRTLLVARNKNETNQNGLQGSVIYVTRELQMPNREELLEELQYLNVKEKNKKVQGIIVTPEITNPTIVGTNMKEDTELIVNPNTKIKPLKNSSYQDWLDYETEFEPQQSRVEVDIEETDRERELREKREARQKLKGLTTQQKAEAKAREKAEAKAAKEQVKVAKEQAKVAEKLAKEEEKRLEKERKTSPEYIAAEKKRKEDEKALKEQKKLEAKRKSAATSAERKERERIRQQKINDFKETEEGIVLQKELEDLEEKMGMLQLQKMELGKTKKRGEKITPENQEKINNIMIEIKNVEEQIKTTYNTMIQQATGELIGGKNKSRKNSFLYDKKHTKKFIKYYNKLTRKYLKQRKMRKTKKYIS